MIKLTFKEPQTFVANKDQFDSFTSSELLVNDLSMNEKMTSFNYMGFKLVCFTKSIEQVKPTEL